MYQRASEGANEKGQVEVNMHNDLFFKVNNRNDDFNYQSTNALYKFHIKTLKIAQTCFDPKIILRKLRCSLLKSF